MSNSIHEKPVYTIGRVAAAASVNVETVRYYQRRGLIDEPEKPYGGFRYYSVDVVEQIRFIKRAQKLGFSLKEISELLELGSGQCSNVRKRAELKRDKIHQQIRDLLVLRDTLDQLICACKEGSDKHYCPIVETLLEQGSQSAA